MIDIAQALRQREGLKLVFTNGVFDILHAGHVRCLHQARAFGDLLFVGVNTDESVHRLEKGPGRPFNPLLDRAEVLEALRDVDAVIPFQADTPIDLILALRPEVYVKGGDYVIEQLPEAAAVTSYGGRVEIVALLPGRSTTVLARKMTHR